MVFNLLPEGKESTPVSSGYKKQTRQNQIEPIFLLLIYLISISMVFDITASQS